MEIFKVGCVSSQHEADEMDYIAEVSFIGKRFRELGGTSSNYLRKKDYLKKI